MNKTTQEQFAELIALTQLHITQEYAKSDWINSDTETVQFFKGLKKAVSKPIVELPKPPISKKPMIVKEESAPKITEEKPKAQPIKPSKFELEPVQEVTQVDFNEMRQILAQHFPQQVVLDEIPNHNEAKASFLIPEVVVLALNENAKYHAFLSNLSKAINRQIAPAELLSAQVWEKGENWEEFLKSEKLRLVIVSDRTLHALPNLMKLYRENAKMAKQYLGRVPVQLLPDIGVYFQRPQLKVDLWKAIQKVASSQ